MHAGRWVGAPGKMKEMMAKSLFVFFFLWPICYSVLSFTLGAGVCMLAVLCGDLLCPVFPSSFVPAPGHWFSSSACGEELGSWSVWAVLFRLAFHARAKLLYLGSCGRARRPSSSFCWVVFTSCIVWHILGVLRVCTRKATLHCRLVLLMLS